MTDRPYAAAFRAAERAVRDRLQSLHAEADQSAKLQRAAVHPEHLRMFAQNLKSVHRLGIEDLIKAAAATASEDAGRAMAMAEEAVHLAQREGLPSVRVAAQLELANCLRVSGDLRSAEQGLLQAGRALRNPTDGIGDPLLTARYLRLRASLSSNLREHARAVRFLRTARSMYTQLGQMDELTLTKTKLALSLSDLGWDLEAIAEALSALRMARHEGQHNLLQITLHNLLAVLVEAEYWQCSADLLREAVRVLSDSRLVETRVRVLAARITAGQGAHAAAAAILRDCPLELDSAGAGFEALQASILLALFHIEAGQAREAAGLTAEILPACTALALEAETLMALRLAAESAQVDVLRQALKKANGALRMVPVRPVRLLQR